MATPGKVVLREGGKRGLPTGGKAAVHNSAGDCPACCGCKPRTVARTFMDYGDIFWDLSAFLGDHVGGAGGFWRIVGMTGCLVYFRGCIDVHGRLLNLQATYRSASGYADFMELQIGCLGEDGYVHYVGTCIPLDPRYLYVC